MITLAPAPPDRGRTNRPAAVATSPEASRLAAHVRAGLSSAEVEERRSRGLVNTAPAAPSRTFGQILRANVATPINVILGALFVVVILVAPPQDALFGLVIVFNSVIGTVQELRAKRTLDRLSFLSAPHARVVRDGVSQDADIASVVQDDVLDVGPGDQIVVDGAVGAAVGLEVDESLLTGESDPSPKAAGDAVLSGSIVVAGSGRYVATKVGASSYAARLAEEARRFSLVDSALQKGILRILRIVTVLMVPASVVLVTGQFRSGLDWREAAQRSAGGIVPLIPEGLILLTSMAFAAGVIRLGQRRCLVKELPAVELLARTTVVCLDKTGTITDGRIEVRQVIGVAEPADGEVDDALAAMAHAEDHPNATLAAIARHATARPDWAVTSRVPFASERKWSAAAFAGRGAWFLGAPEILLDSLSRAERDHTGGARSGDGLVEAVTGHVAAEAAGGRRVVLVASAPDLAWDSAGEWVLPPGLRPRALVVLEEQIRPDAADTIGFFRRQGVELRVISGDNPVTVGSVAERVGVPGADQPVDARELPEDPGALADVVATRTVYGRVTPDQKRSMVAALQSRGHVVAMTGDGVNDVLALKDADLGIAIGAGTPASRAVAQVVLLDDSFASLPSVVAEGRRVIANIERVANLFLTKTVYAVILAVVIGMAAVTYPFLPRHLTLISALAIGIPGFFIALAPARQRAQPDFVGRVARFVVVSGSTLAVGVLVTYGTDRAADGASQLESQTAATLTLLGLSLVVLVLVAQPLTPLRLSLVAGMAALGLVVVAVPFTREFFALDVPDAASSALVGAVVVVGGTVLVLARRIGRLLPDPEPVDALPAPSVASARADRQAGATDLDGDGPGTSIGPGGSP